MMPSLPRHRQNAPQPTIHTNGEYSILKGSRTRMSPNHIVLWAENVMNVLTRIEPRCADEYRSKATSSNTEAWPQIMGATSPYLPCKVASAEAALELTSILIFLLTLPTKKCSQKGENKLLEKQFLP